MKIAVVVIALLLGVVWWFNRSTEQQKFNRVGRNGPQLKPIGNDKAFHFRHLVFIRLFLVVNMSRINEACPTKPT
jgi:hypothetical protein